MKLWSSVRGQAEKMAFEADKMMRVKREESTVAEAQSEIQARQLSLGQVALALYRSGALQDAQVAQLAQEIAALEVQVQEGEARVAAIKAEQFRSAEEAAVVAPTTAPAAASVVAPDAPPSAPAASAAAMPAAPAPAAAKPRFCANCGKAVPASAGFCPECGTKMGGGS
jgi:peptidoglycan hydrolase CwlO-like protein